MRGNPGQVIERLREAGWEVYVQHRRRSVHSTSGRGWPRHMIYGTLSSKGGGTEVVLKRDSRIFTGTAIVHPSDNFDRRLGLRVALGRAMLAAAHGHRGESQRMILFGQWRNGDGHVEAVVDADFARRATSVAGPDRPAWLGVGPKGTHELVANADVLVVNGEVVKARYGVLIDRRDGALPPISSGAFM